MYKSQDLRQTLECSDCERLEKSVALKKRDFDAFKGTSFFGAFFG